MNERPAAPQPNQTTSTLAIASLICALAFFVFPGIGFFFPILALIFGRMALKEIKQSNGHLTGRPMAKIGITIGLVLFGLEIIAVICGLIGFALGLTPLVLRLFLILLYRPSEPQTMLTMLIEMLA